METLQTSQSFDFIFGKKFGILNLQLNFQPQIFFLADLLALLGTMEMLSPIILFQLLEENGKGAIFGEKHSEAKRPRR